MRFFPLYSRVLEHDSGQPTHRSNPSPKSRLKRGIYARAIAFFLFEFSFIAFAYYCLFHPIPIQSKASDTLEILSSFNATLTEAKSATAATAVVWQAIACLFVKDIINIVRSAEFVAQYRQLGELTPGVTDRVSTITSGVIDGLVHFVGESCTGEFRLMFIAMLAVMIVGPLGSATVTVGTTMLHTTRQIEVANVTSPSSDGDFLLFKNTVPDLEDRIKLIMQMENGQHTTFGYQMSTSPETENLVLIPWPQLEESLEEESTLIYRSDVLQFLFQYSWTTPKLIAWHSTSGAIYPTFAVNGLECEVEIRSDYFLGKSNILRIELELKQSDQNLGILPLLARGDYGGTAYADIEPNNTFLFFERVGVAKIGTVPSNGSTVSEVEFPTSFSGIPSGVQVSNGSLIWAALTCDSHTSWTTAEITLRQNSLFARVLPGSLPIRNVSPGVFGKIANYPLAFLKDEWSSGPIQLNNVHKDVFLRLKNATKDTRSFLDLSSSFKMQLEVLPLDDINRNINQYTLSGAKAFLDGTAPAPGDLSALSLTMNQTVQVSFPVAAVVSSKPFLIALTIIIGVLSLLIATMLWIIRRTELCLFNLEHLIEVIGA
ncbi:hypothetical protein NP233_g1840 [Leucocoprinus birnbaumii]|uniref:Uncharacterized protein n=1 Tax=Leucocoprinus birnbaumii TaxID=56174 RepID=A0AAD5VZE5_9AGAR|nr:hypothetical protein NP233_g1840 [Leucocoprinus birnbaumii]